LETVAAAVYVINTCRDRLLDARILSIHIPGDSDTLGSVVGALSGAELGIGAFDNEEIPLLQDVDELLELAYNIVGRSAWEFRGDVEDVGYDLGWQEQLEKYCRTKKFTIAGASGPSNWDLREYGALLVPQKLDPTIASNSTVQSAIDDKDKNSNIKRTFFNWPTFSVSMVSVLRGCKSAATFSYYCVNTIYSVFLNVLCKILRLNIKS
jgi:hypothetical protein